MATLTKEELLSRFDILRTEYIKLLNDKDVLEHWGKPQLEALYASRIGSYQVEQLQLELRAKALKRKIEMVRSIIVRNLPLDVEAIERQAAAELAEAQLQVMQQVAKVEQSKAMLSHLESPERSAELRKIFKQLAKQLHPDVNPRLTAEQKEIWHKVKEAYETGDLEKIKALQVIYEKEISKAEDLLERLGEEEIKLKNEVMAEGIKQLEKEIQKIRCNFPFDIEDKIKDEAWVTEQQQAIQKMIDRLRVYEGELILEYEALVNGYGGTHPGLN